MHKNSKIFKTITNEITGANKSVGLLGLSLKNVNDLIYDISTRGFKNVLFNTPTINLDQNAIEEYNFKIRNGVNAHEALTQASQNTNQETIALMRSMNGATIEEDQLTEAQRASTLAAKAQSAALKGLSIALNIAVFTVAMKVIQGVAKAIDDYVNRAKYAIEAMEDAQQKINDTQNSLQNVSNTINENKDRFIELSKGVDHFSKNLALSEEDYAEYLSISQKLAEISPSLIVGYDEQGNALLNIGNNAEETTQKLNDMLKVQQAIAEQTLAENLDAVAEGVYYEVQEAKDTIYELKHQTDEVSALLVDFKDTFDNNDGIFKFTAENDPFGEYRETVIKAFEAAGIGWEDLGGGQILIDSFKDAMGNGGDGIDEVISIALNKAQEYYDNMLVMQNNVHAAAIAQNEKLISEQEDKIKSSYSKMTANLQAWVGQNANYQYLSDSAQDLVNSLIPEIDWNNLGFELADGTEYEKYINDNILMPLMKLPSEAKPEIDKMFAKLLSFQDGDLNILSFAEQLQEELSKYNITIDLTPIISDEQSAKERLQNSINSIAAGSDYYNVRGKQVNAKDYETLELYTRRFNTEQIELWNKVTLGINGATNAISAYENALKSADNEQSDLLSPTISSTIDQLNTQLKPAFDALKEAYLDIFTTDDDGKEVFTLENVDLSMLDEIKSAIDDLNSNEDLGIYIDYSSFDNLANVLTDTKSTAEDVHNAINSFAGKIIQSLNPSLSETTEETYQLTQAMLKSLGVMNSEEVMASALGYSLEELAELRKAAASAGFDLENATDREIRMFIWEQTEAGNCSEALYLLQLKKVLLNQTAINTTGDIEYILGLAQSAGVASNALSKLADAKAMLETATAKGDTRGIYEAKKYARELQNEIRNDIVSFEIPEIKFEPPSNSSSNSKSSGSSSEKDTTETFDWIEQAIENVEKEIQSLDETVNSAYSTFSQKNKALADEIGKVNDEINLQQKAYDEYMRKAESVGLSDQYKSLVQSGDINIEDIKDEKLQKQIDEYQKWYDKAQEANEAIKDLKTDIKDLYVSAYELQTENLKDRLDSDSITQKEYLDQLRVKLCPKVTISVKGVWER